jgi:hypothetical protein
VSCQTTPCRCARACVSVCVCVCFWGAGCVQVHTLCARVCVGGGVAAGGRLPARAGLLQRQRARRATPTPRTHPRTSPCTRTTAQVAAGQRGAGAGPAAAPLRTARHLHHLEGTCARACWWRAPRGVRAAWLRVRRGGGGARCCAAQRHACRPRDTREHTARGAAHARTHRRHLHLHRPGRLAASCA